VGQWVSRPRHDDRDPVPLQHGHTRSGAVRYGRDTGRRGRGTDPVVVVVLERVEGILDMLHTSSEEMARGTNSVYRIGAAPSAMSQEAR